MAATAVTSAIMFGMNQRLLRLLHRRMGITSALFVILLTVTGLLLQHSPILKLDTSYIQSPALVDWYGIEAPNVDSAFAAGTQHVLQINNQLFFDTQPLTGSFSDLRGVVRTDYGYLVATTNQLLLLTESGQIIEILSATHNVPRAIARIGVSTDGGIHVQSGAQMRRFDIDELLWPVSEIGPAGAQWSRPTTAPAELIEQLRAEFTTSVLSWERVLTDLHSGRLFGALGVIVVDVMAVLFLLMALSGLWIWTRRRS